MPKNKDDFEAAQSIIQLGSPTIDPVFKDMLLWLRIYKSPVADIFATFFAQLAPQPIDLIKKYIGTNSETLRNRILVDILPKWPVVAIQQLSINLTTLATRPDISNNDIECFSFIIKYDLAEPSWVKQYIDLRKKQADERVQLLTELEISIS